jgi:uncharacterized membrane protein YeaQ/YmgE (transglycosylase-associated protein family)
MLLHFIFQILCGIFVGWLAGVLIRGKGYGMILDLIIGVVGSVLANTILSFLHIYVFGGFSSDLAVSVGGAVLLLALLRMVKGK